MDTKKLLSKINLILKIEEESNISGSIQNIFSSLQNNQIEKLNVAKKHLYSVIKESELNNFVNTDLKILDFLSCREYSSIDLIDKIENILSLKSYEINASFQKFIDKRNNALNKIKKLQNSFFELEIKEEIETEKYQLVFSFPEKYHQLENLEKVTKDINFFLNELNSNKKEDKESFQISSVNNGCIEFFIECGQYLAENFLTILDYILKLYAVIQMFNDGKGTYKNYSEKRKKLVENLAEEELEENKTKILEEIPKELKIENKEAQTKVIKHVKIMVEHFENGVNIEIKVPFLEKPEDLTEDDDDKTKKEKKEKLKNYEKRKMVNDTNRKLLKMSNEKIKLELSEPTSKKPTN